MSTLERPERLQIMLSPEELQALEDFRFENRMPSRAAAVRELLRRGLQSGGFLKVAAGAKSQDFGVIDNDATDLPQNDS
ncbi:hypothetical protein [Chelativorans salis]|uniref:Ribbon-helix-helix protein CopG domain-containing protein n=1 Tax=Chelativorans salis TaxID=2978478 RepID=A0ABT2LLJ8_9HYPH|nr:hypothetical protein [Chelativorans sp. EGI FJ00035]MCT7375455.1 hypothetical protein [Chelativorans sp. EGI FJ00035]